MRHRLAGVLVPFVAAIVTAATFAGCGGGGRRGGQVVPTTCIAFQGMTAPTDSTVVTRQGSGSQCEMLQVELVLTNVMDVLSVGDFTVHFDPAFAEYEGLSQAGSVLTSDGANLTVLVTESPAQVTINLSRINTGIDFNGPGSVVRLIFSPAANAVAGASALSFSATQIFGSEAPPQEKAGIQWIGGSFQVTDN